MAVLPEIEDWAEDYGFTESEIRLLASFTWLLIILNGALLLMILVNIWVVLIE